MDAEKQITKEEISMTGFFQLSLIQEMQELT